MKIKQLRLTIISPYQADMVDSLPFKQMVNKINELVKRINTLEKEKPKLKS